MYLIIVSLSMGNNSHIHYAYKVLPEIVNEVRDGISRLKEHRLFK